eukprot:tig00000144_g9159.t1
MRMLNSLNKRAVRGDVCRCRVVQREAMADALPIWVTRGAPLPAASQDYARFGSDVPIVIDNGSYQCRVGWASEKSPRVELRALVGRPRNRKETDKDALVGADLRDEEVVKMITRSAFDRNVLYHTDTQEAIFDSSFEYLGVVGDKVDHSIVMTEPLCNPNYCRKMMSELLFEGYGIPSVCYGIDGLFSFHHYAAPRSLKDGLVVSLGHSACHVIPVLNGSPVINKSKRIDTGGLAVTETMFRLVNMKYPHYRSALHWGRAQVLAEEYSFVAGCYDEQLRACEEESTIKSLAKAFQLPFVAAPEETEQTEEDKQKVQQRKKEAGQRLKDLQEKRRKEKMQQVSEELSTYEQLLGLKDTDKDSFMAQLQELELKTEAKLFKRIQELRTWIVRAQNKEKGIPDEPVQASEPKLPDERKMEEKMQQEKELQESEQLRQQNPTLWLQELHSQRQTILMRKAEKDKRRKDRAERKGAAARSRREAVAKAVGEGDDEFGDDGDGWMVYRTMAGEDSDSDEGDLDQMLRDVESKLTQHDPQFSGQQAGAGAAPSGQGKVEIKAIPNDFRIAVDIERFRAPEVLFQPGIIGVEQAGVTDCEICKFPILSEGVPVTS